MKKNISQSIFYVTRDIERALGCLSISSIFIISNNSPFAKSIQKKYPHKIFLIEAKKPLDTYDLLNHKKTREIMAPFKKPKIMVFKNTTRIELWCKKYGYILCNPAPQLAAKIEEKITQLTTLKNIRELMPRYEKKILERVAWIGAPFILQFNHSHTGSGTLYIDSEKTLETLKEKFPKREIRTVPFIKGPVFTSNIVIAKDTFLFGNISYQITGIVPFTDLPFATIGNDWGAPYRILTTSAQESYDALAKEVAATLKNLGWKGLFGIDAIWSTKEKRWYLIEINARQPASASYESELQHVSNPTKDDHTLTILEAHIKALIDEPLVDYSIIKISNGAQIIQRVTHIITTHELLKDKILKLKKENLHVIEYENTVHNSDLVRIQSQVSIVKNETNLTTVGEKIKSILS